MNNHKNFKFIITLEEFLPILYAFEIILHIVEVVHFVQANRLSVQQSNCVPLIINLILMYFHV